MSALEVEQTPGGVWCAIFMRGRVRGASRLSKGIGRNVLAALIRGRCMMEGINPGVKWCSGCGRYYAMNTEHVCYGREISQNRSKLEFWLGEGKFSIKEEG